MTLLGLLGILVGLGLLIAFAFRGWSVLLLAPIAAAVAALFSREPLLAHWTLTFMGSAAGFFAQFFPLFLLGALFGKLMEDSGSVASIASYMTEKLGPKRAPFSERAGRDWRLFLRARARELGIELAGNGYDGIGVPDCLASGLRAAAHVLRDPESETRP